MSPVSSLFLTSKIAEFWRNSKIFEAKSKIHLFFRLLLRTDVRFGQVCEPSNWPNSGSSDVNSWRRLLRFWERRDPFPVTPRVICKNPFLPRYEFFKFSFRRRFGRPSRSL